MPLIKFTIRFVKSEAWKKKTFQNVFSESCINSSIRLTHTHTVSLVNLALVVQ